MPAKRVAVRDCAYVPFVVLAPEPPTKGKEYAISAGYYLENVLHDPKTHNFSIKIYHGSTLVHQDTKPLTVGVGDPTGLFLDIFNYKGICDGPIKIELNVSCNNLGKILFYEKAIYPLGM